MNVEGDAKIVVYDIDGQLIDDLQQEDGEINISHLANGIYYPKPLKAGYTQLTKITKI